MISLISLAAAVTALAALPWLVVRGRPLAVPPRLLAAVHLVTLTGLALLPAGVAVCAGLGLARPATGLPALAARCGLGQATGPPAMLLAAALAAATLAPVAWQVARLLRAAARTELAGAALAGARRWPLPGGAVVWVLPSAELAACACGLRRPKAMVTSGLLSLLDPAEQQAVAEHEAAHVRLGHPRLLLLGAAVARAYAILPPARQAWSGLRRELEAAADEEAARAAGTGPLLSALARVALARAAPGRPATPGTPAAFGDPAHLRYRITRLQQPRPAHPGACAGVAAAATTLIALLAWAACGLASGTATADGLATCATLLAATGLQPLRPRLTRNRANPRASKP
jgi:Zn-dependent protease with chaperone function